MENAKIKDMVETINRVEMQMIDGMTEEEYAAYKAIPEETRKAMLFMAYKAANA